MRQQDKVIIWPAYFDSTKTRKEGRKIPKKLAVPAPKISEMKEAADKLKLDCEIVPDVGYSKTPWMKTGMILVKKIETKNQIIKKIAKQLVKIREVAATRMDKA